MTTPHPFAALLQWPQWILWRGVPDEDKPGKTKKVPLDARTFKACNPVDPASHSTYADAIAALQRYPDGATGVGFVFMATDPFWFVDVDDCVTPAGEWSPLAQNILQRLAGCGVELSQSRKGLHIFGTGTVPEHSCKNIDLKLELYTENRFCAVTFDSATGDAGYDASAAITQYAIDFFPPNAGSSDVVGWRDEPLDGWDVTLADDDHLIERATKTGENTDAGAAARFGLYQGKVPFGQLFTGDERALSAVIPGNSPGGYDASQADGALAGHLCYWTGHNHERVERLMRRSALARAKWDDRPEYLENTIIGVSSLMASQGKFARPREGTVTPEKAEAAGMTYRSPDDAYLSAAAQMERFRDCVYVRDVNRIWSPTTPVMMDKARFDAQFGGPLFAMRYDGTKPDKSAWNAYTQNGQYEPRRADTTCFRPEHPSGTVVESGGRTVVNTYVPVVTLRKAGDPYKFVRHLQLICGEDWGLVQTYMASMVRNPGKKFPWALLIAGPEGNGKTFISMAMQHAIGERYSSGVNPAAMKKTANQFNGYIAESLFLVIEEIFAGNDPDFLDSFKETVTNLTIPVEKKGVDSRMTDNRANLILFTNRYGAIPITVDARRYCILHCPQRNYADMLRDGLNNEYFSDLYDWAYGRGAYAHEGENHGWHVITEYLSTVPLIAALDPAGAANRAPRTASFDEALLASMSPAEQELQTAIDEERPGFAGGWLSAHKADELLRSKGYRLSRHAQNAAFEKLGYIRHPKLERGRVNNPVQPDNAKVTLYTTREHPSHALINAAEIAASYSGAQLNTEAAHRFTVVN